MQMIERPLMTPDELKSLPKGEFIVMKTGTHPMRTHLHLFTEWGITFTEEYQVPEQAARKVYYASYHELIQRIQGIDVKDNPNSFGNQSQEEKISAQLKKELWQETKREKPR